MRTQQLELPYPVGPLILEPILTPKAIKQLRTLDKEKLTDFILRDWGIDYENLAILRRGNK